MPNLKDLLNNLEALNETAEKIVSKKDNKKVVDLEALSIMMNTLVALRQTEQKAELATTARIEFHEGMVEILGNLQEAITDANRSNATLQQTVAAQVYGYQNNDVQEALESFQTQLAALVELEDELWSEPESGDELEREQNLAANAAKSAVLLTANAKQAKGVAIEDNFTTENLQHSIDQLKDFADENLEDSANLGVVLGAASEIEYAIDLEGMLSNVRSWLPEYQEDKDKAIADMVFHLQTVFNELEDGEIVLLPLGSFSDSGRQSALVEVRRTGDNFKVTLIDTGNVASVLDQHLGTAQKLADAAKDATGRTLRSYQLKDLPASIVTSKKFIGSLIESSVTKADSAETGLESLVGVFKDHKDVLHAGHYFGRNITGICSHSVVAAWLAHSNAVMPQHIFKSFALSLHDSATSLIKSVASSNFDLMAQAVNAVIGTDSASASSSTSVSEDDSSATADPASSSSSEEDDVVVAEAEGKGKDKAGDESNNVQAYLVGIARHARAKLLRTLGKEQAQLSANVSTLTAVKQALEARISVLNLSKDADSVQAEITRRYADASGKLTAYYQAVKGDEFDAEAVYPSDNVVAPGYMAKTTVKSAYTAYQTAQSAYQAAVDAKAVYDADTALYTETAKELGEVKAKLATVNDTLATISCLQAPFDAVKKPTVTLANDASANLDEHIALAEKRVAEADEKVADAAANYWKASVGEKQYDATADYGTPTTPTWLQSKTCDGIQAAYSKYQGAVKARDLYVQDRDFLVHDKAQTAAIAANPVTPVVPTEEAEAAATVSPTAS